MECQCNDQNFLAKGTKDNHKRKEEVDILIYYHALTFLFLQASNKCTCLSLSIP
jgi:hypothetical protein